MPMSMGQVHMRIDQKMLMLTQWLSPSYPTGAFAWSHGLEAAIQARWVHDAASLENWLADLLQDGSGRSDAVFIALAEACGSNRELRIIDQKARAFAPSAERLRESARQGAAFTRVTRAVWNMDLPDLVLPVALGRAAHLQALPVADTAALYLQSFASNLISAAQRLMPLGQTDGQAVLAHLSPLCEAIASEAITAGEDATYSNCFLSDIAAMQHETHQPRLFQS